MFGLVLALALVVAPQDGAELESGSLIVIRGGNKAVAAWTSSDVTHVAILVHEGSQAMVYEATPNQVRKLTLKAYQVEVSRFKDPLGKSVQVGVMRPKTAYTPAQMRQMFALLQDQLGKPYSVRDYVKGNDSGGTHCAEFAARCLDSSGKYRFDKPFVISPGKLVELLQETYTPVEYLPVPTFPEDKRTWCQKSWGSWGARLSWCGWACGESWAWLW